MVKLNRPQTTIEYGACAMRARLTQGAESQLECEIIIVFPERQWLRESTSVLTLYAHCLSC